MLLRGINNGGRARQSPMSSIGRIKGGEGVSKRGKARGSQRPNYFFHILQKSGTSRTSCRVAQHALRSIVAAHGKFDSLIVLLLLVSKMKNEKNVSWSSLCK